MDFFSLILFSGSIFYSFITGMTLLLRKKDQVFTSRLLGAAILSLGWYAMVYVAVSSKLLVYIPYTYRVGSPIYYLIPPLCYLYIRSLVKGETGFRKSDWVHFILPVINVIDLMPYYFSSAEHKRQVVNSLIHHVHRGVELSTGLLPDVVHYMLRPLQGIIYLAFQWALLIMILKKEKTRMPRFEQGGYWLFTFTLLGTLMYAGMGYVALHGNQNSAASTHIIAILLMIGFLVLSLHLFINPELLYGVQVVSSVKVYKGKISPDHELKNDTSAKKQLTPEYISSCIHNLEKYMQEKELFRQQGLSVYELASALNIPSSNLSFILNRHYGQRFNDFINTSRVNYVMGRFKEASWKELTMEGLAYEAGFNSRTAFFISFKKITGLNPTDYLAQSRQKEQ
jgi:AraC-like DNA-binding protein